MSLPTTITLSSQDEVENKEDLVNEIQNMYEDIAENVNGFIRNNAETDQAQWKPTLAGTVAGNFTYTGGGHQYGWSVRQGIYTKLFFDIKWTASTATGNLYLELPYKVTPSSGMPFVGTVQASNVAFLGNYLVINAIPDTYRGEFFSVTSAAAATNLTVKASGRLIGSIDYIGVADE